MSKTTKIIIWVASAALLIEIGDGKLRLPNEDGDPWEWKFHFYKNQFYSVYD